MKISQLPASNSFSNDDVVAIEINGVTYKLTGATLEAALRALGHYAQTTGIELTGVIRSNNSAFDLTQANNGVTETFWPSPYQIIDKNRYLSNVFGGIVFANGLVTSRMVAANRDSNNQQVTGTLSVGVDKTGAVSYGVTDPAAFRKAIGQNDLTPISIASAGTPYISSVSGGYQKFGRMVVFTIYFTMKAALNTSLTDAFTGFPAASAISKFCVNDGSKADATAARFANVAGTTMSLGGPFAATGAYRVSGAYISTT